MTVSRIDIRKIIVLAVWFGSVAGCVELLIIGVRKLVFQQMVFVGPQIVWMTPLSYVIFFGVVSLGLCLAAWWWPKLVSLRLVVFLFAFVGTFSILFLWHPRLHKYAIVLVALGLAVQTARWSTIRSQTFHSLVNRTVVWIVMVVAALGIGIHGWRELVERRALANLPPAPANSPNVLLIVLDTVRAQSLSLYGYDRRTTPRLEEFAKKGVRFDRAISTAPWTLPSHASMFTGRWPHEMSANWLTPLNADHPTLAEILQTHGYVTAGFVANVRYCGHETGLSRGFIHYEDYPFSVGEVIISSSLGRFITNSPVLRQSVGSYDVLNRKTAAMMNHDFLTWLSGVEERPFFAFLNYFDAHEPYVPPKPFDTMFGPTDKRGPFMFDGNRAWHVDAWSMPPEKIRAQLNAYEGGITYIDHNLGLLFEELERRKLMANTLVIITSDHGEQLGEHKLFGHLNSLYMPLLNVPLIIVFPTRVPTAKIVSQPISLRDLGATVLDAIGIEKASFPGESLARFWQLSPKANGGVTDTVFSQLVKGHVEQDWYPVAKGNMNSLVVHNHHYILNGDGREELYDLQRDPLERNDLAKIEKSRPLLEQFGMLLRRIVSSAPSPK